MTTKPIVHNSMQVTIGDVRVVHVWNSGTTVQVRRKETWVREAWFASVRDARFHLVAKYGHDWAYLPARVEAWVKARDKAHNALQDWYTSKS